jgi:diguanylate cyclase (GGDEF)-like protein
MIASDHVTGLAPRGDLESLLAEVLAAERPAGRVAVVICDVVGLKAINEREGFRAGDAVLAGAGQALRDAAGEARLLARLGGDELVAVFVGAEAPIAASRTAAALAADTRPRLRSAAVIAEQNDTPGRLVDRLYATMRRS